ncbi:MAG: hypothetical protein FJZ38_17905 [Candidatus Rokubacteria bacterium]|nr:hypothetical protein [Candidatus Rokubacteria bacterium]
MDDRRYRQSGYKDSGRQREAPRRPSDAPNPGAVLKNRPVSRCAACGATLPVTAESLAECPSCRAALHACRQCAHLDPGQRFECTEPVAARIADKQQVNDCGSFSLRVTVERETSSGAVRPEDARRGFNNLFKT